MPPYSIAFCAACAKVRLPPGPDTRSLATLYASGLPPCAFAATSCSFLIASFAAACAARVIACAVWLPAETQVHGRFFDVLPKTTSHFSQGTPSISAAWRCTSNAECVPRLPMPDWNWMRPSGLMRKSPSKPMEPPAYGLTATPMPRALLP